MISIIDIITALNNITEKRFINEVNTGPKTDPCGTPTDRTCSRLLITPTLANLNLTLTRTKIDFPLISFMRLL